jgi:hypothetical protein
MRVVFEGRDKKDRVDVKKDGKFKLLPVPDDDVSGKPSTSGVSAGLSVGSSGRGYVGRVEPEPPLDVPKPPVTPVRADIESFKSDFMSVFGIESIIPSNKDVLILNLLFAIFSQLKDLNDKFTEKE